MRPVISSVISHTIVECILGVTERTPLAHYTVCEEAMTDHGLIVRSPETSEGRPGLERSSSGRQADSNNIVTCVHV